MNKINILLADDDPVVTSSLKIILETSGEVNVLGVADSGSEAIELFRRFTPDVLLMDIRMGEMSGISAAKKILNEFPKGRILFLTTFSDDDYIVEALKIGSKGYILKQDYEGIIPALKAVLRGKTVFCSDVVEKIAAFMPKESDFDPESHDLGEKEMEIIEMVGSGLSNKEIAGRLYLSEGTVRNYISGILLKLNLRDRTGLAVFYCEHIRV